MGLLHESFSADIQREFPPLVAPQAMSAWFDSIFIPLKEPCEGLAASLSIVLTKPLQG